MWPQVVAGETPEAALVRELAEELGVGVAPGDLAPLAFASHTYQGSGFHLLMPLYACRRWQGTPRGCEGQALAWADENGLGGFEMPPADEPLLPAVRALMQSAPAAAAPAAAAGRAG